MSAPPAVDRARSLIVGTAGHIDHGKSRLVWALTGRDPDRLPDEQRRGMTIDLGFAHLRAEEVDLWMVDVPGHERFIRNMVAGATGIDAALLVVAADDALMPQTREHADVLALLGVKLCVIAVNKVDLVDQAWAAAVGQDAIQLLTERGLTPVEVVYTSAQTGQGLPELRAALIKLARHHRDDAQRPADWFRMHIDRAFLMAGRGVVVTGSVLHGQVGREDELELLPAGTRVRVRELRAADAIRDASVGRTRLALNLTGIELEQVGRGMSLASVGRLSAGRRYAVALSRSNPAGERRTKISRVRVLCGTLEARARLVVAGDGESKSGVQLVADTPLALAYGDRFLLRDDSATRILGGGVVEVPLPERGRRGVFANAGNVMDPLEVRLADYLAAHEWVTRTHAELAAKLTGPSDAALAGALQRLLADRLVVEILSGPSRLLVWGASWRSLLELLRDRLTSWINNQQRLAGLPQSEWVGWMPRACPQRFRAALADRALADGSFALRGGYVTLASSEPSVQGPDAALLEAILAEFAAGRYAPPVPAELRCRTVRNARKVDELIRLAAAQGQLVRIADGLWLHRSWWDQLVQDVVARIRTSGGMTVAALRDLTGSSRKFVVPIAEALEAAGITRRFGDLRQLGPKAPR